MDFQLDNNKSQKKRKKNIFIDCTCEKYSVKVNVSRKKVMLRVQPRNTVSRLFTKLHNYTLQRSELEKYNNEMYKLISYHYFIVFFHVNVLQEFYHFNICNYDTMTMFSLQYRSVYRVIRNRLIYLSIRNNVKVFRKYKQKKLLKVIYICI